MRPNRSASPCNFVTISRCLAHFGLSRRMRQSRGTAALTPRASSTGQILICPSCRWTCASRVTLGARAAARTRTGSCASVARGRSCLGGATPFPTRSPPRWGAPRPPARPATLPRASWPHRGDVPPSHARALPLAHAAPADPRRAAEALVVGDPLGGRFELLPYSLARHVQESRGLGLGVCVCHGEEATPRAVRVKTCPRRTGVYFRWV